MASYEPIPGEGPGPRRWRRAGVVAAAAACALGGAAALRSGAVASLAASKLYVSCDTAGCRDVADDDDYFKDESLIYYETGRITLSPEGGCAFKKDVLGFAATTYNYTAADPLSGATAACASTCTSASVNNVVHLDTLSVGTRAGPTRPAAWIESFNALRADMSDESWTWDKFAYRSSAYYAPDLTLHALKVQTMGLPHARRSYDNVVDGSQMYALFVNDPHTGAVVEIHAPAIDDDLKAKFAKPLEASSCPEALKVGFSTEDMRSWWGYRNGRSVNDLGLPDLLLVKVSEPASSLDAAQHFVNRLHGKATSRWAVDVERGFIGNENTTASREHACAYSTSKFFAPEDEGSVEFRMVQNDHARDGAEGMALTDWEEYVKELHGKMMGPDLGWDRFMDNRHGLSTANTKDSPDDIKSQLDHSGTPYHAHVTSEDGATGTLYTAGFAATAIAFHGTFDYSAFDAAATTYFDYCAQTM